MDSKRFKLFLRRHFKRHQSNLGSFGDSTEKTIDKHFLKRIDNLKNVKRQVASWFILIFLVLFIGVVQLNALHDKYSPVKFAPGGIFSEGIVGDYTNANPIYANSAVDNAVSKLIFSGLLKYDEHSKLQPDLAQSITLAKDEKTYTVKLRDGITWQDGKPITSADVLFTFETIKDPDSNSFLAPGWEGVEITTPDDKTVVFKLQSALGSFPHSLITGLLPKHILENVPKDQLRVSDFNTISPVGSGPFKLDKIDLAKNSADHKTQSVGLIPFEGYYAGKPALNRYIIKTFSDSKELKKAYDAKDVSAASDASTIFNSESKERNTFFNVKLAAETMVFFNNSRGVLKDSTVRKALVLAINKPAVIAASQTASTPINEPFLTGHFSYNPAYRQISNKPAEAQKLLAKAKWKAGPDGVLKKGKTALSFNLFVANKPESRGVADELRKQWARIGVNVNVISQGDEQRKSTIATHDYDALLNSISVGADPDVYAFWHSSQFSAALKTRLNFSEYDSTTADRSLEGGRSRTDEALRKIKYKPFLQAWSRDNPALALYQPQYTFLVRPKLDGFDVQTIVSPADKYFNVENWKIRQKRDLF